MSAVPKTDSIENHKSAADKTTTDKIKKNRPTRRIATFSFPRRNINKTATQNDSAGVERKSSMPSVIAATLVGQWRNCSLKKRGSNNTTTSCPSSVQQATNEPSPCAQNGIVVPSEDSAGDLRSAVRGSSASTDDGDLTSSDIPLHDYQLSEQSHEVLMQIIRCFPFPSPKTSPRTPQKKPFLSRTTSTDISDSSKNNNVKIPLTPGPDFLAGHSPWSITKRFLHKHHPHLPHISKNNSNSACNSVPTTPNGNDVIHSPLTSSPSTPTINTDASKAAEDINSIQPRGALGKLCQISVDTMAITALPLDCWLRERLKNWVQLSGHEGTIVPASNHTLWKKQPSANLAEAKAYSEIMQDPALRGLTPKFFKEIMHNNESFIEIQDLLSQFPNTSARSIMDIKMGQRTFLMSEVSNKTKRTDLYKKMVDIDPNEPTEEENADKAITKLRYMKFRERESSTATLGFRIEAAQLPGGKLQKCFKKVRTKDQVLDTLLQFFGTRQETIRRQLCERLKFMREGIENSTFFHTHEVVGSSILIIYDDTRCGAWMIDFAKSTRAPDDMHLDHRTDKDSDGYLVGLDNLIEILDPKTEKISHD